MKTTHQTLRSAVIVALLVAAFVASAPSDQLRIRRVLAAWQRFPVEEYGDDWMTLDRNKDGRIDYAVQVNDRGFKIREAMDFNYNGYMDNFYFYTDGELTRHEIDSNSDQQIDIWVYLFDAIYIRMWERDTNHDGYIDQRVDYEN
ncbi:MAG: hypothetical protein EA382_08865 [Spirochaetaceae bacterium]|nr:MAG: hypothetical protein EA382_08865 [Spirochaetaceae bacterium]